MMSPDDDPTTAAGQTPADSAADPSVAAVSVDDYLATGQTGVRLRSRDVPQPSAVNDDVMLFRYVETVLL